MIMSRDVYCALSKSLLMPGEEAQVLSMARGDFTELLAGRFPGEFSQLRRGHVFLLGLGASSMRPGAWQAMP